MCVWYIPAIQLNLPLAALPRPPTSQCNWNPLVFFIHFSCHVSNSTSSNQKVWSVIWPSLCWWHEHNDFCWPNSGQPSWDWYGLPVYHQFFQKMPVAIFNARLEHVEHQRSGTNWATRVGNGQSHCWLPGSSGRGGEEESRRSYHRIRKKRITWCLGLL